MAVTTLYTPWYLDSFDPSIAGVAPIVKKGTAVDNTQVAAVQASALATLGYMLATTVGGIPTTVPAAAFVPPWAANTQVAANQAMLSPAGQVMVRPVAGVTRATFDATEAALWTMDGGTAYEPFSVTGTLAARPSPASFGKGYYFASDVNGGTLYHSDATAWTQQAPGATTAPGNLGYVEFGPAASNAPFSTAAATDQDVTTFTMHLASLPGTSYDVLLWAYAYNDNAAGGVWLKVQERFDSGSYATVINSVSGTGNAASYRHHGGRRRRIPGSGGVPSGTGHTADYKVTLAAVTTGTAWVGDKFSSGHVCGMSADRVA